MTAGRIRVTAPTGFVFIYKNTEDPDPDPDENRRWGKSPKHRRSKKEQKISLGQNGAHKPGEFKLQTEPKNVWKK